MCRSGLLACCELMVCAEGRSRYCGERIECVLVITCTSFAHMLAYTISVGAPLVLDVRNLYANRNACLHRIVCMYTACTNVARCACVCSISRCRAVCAYTSFAEHMSDRTCVCNSSCARSFVFICMCRLVRLSCRLCLAHACSVPRMRWL